MFYLCLTYLRMILLLLLLIHLIQYTEAKRRIRWDCFDCQMDGSFSDQIECRVGGSRHSLLNVELNLLSELEQIKVYINISTKFKSTITFRKFFDINFNGCRVISDMVQGTMVSNMFNAVVKSSNQPRKCPIQKVNFVFHNISIEDALPMFVPTAQLFIQVNFYSRRQLYLNVSVMGEILEK
ncbi:uncharacterized protein LOC108086613 [Drosophila ficusphila]|uniref:uncharacterized protein LOC108086613 n=1 Tax=Drosophila ficusphila TaxID=30025 RepID=UPI0007E5C71A|nr:uncharacterized protein LOC108086613 [Drosophila ficusphila]